MCALRSHVLLLFLGYTCTSAAVFRTSDAVHQRCFHSSEPSCNRFVFTLYAPASDSYAARFATAQTTCEVSVNGRVVHSFANVGATNPVHVPLVKGHNTLAAACTPPLDGLLEIYGTIPVPRRGALLLYSEIEAEAANFSGTLVGPDFTYTHLPSEASQRMAVQLRSPGDYVEFTTSGPANAAMLRFSIPDAPGGGGLTTPVHLYVDDEFIKPIMVRRLSLTSAMSLLLLLRVLAVDIAVLVAVWGLPVQ